MKKFLYLFIVIYICALIRFISGYFIKSNSQYTDYSVAVGMLSGNNGGRMRSHSYFNYNFSTTKGKGESWELTATPLSSKTEDFTNTYNRKASNYKINPVWQSSSSVYHSVNGGIGKSSGNGVGVRTNNADYANSYTATLSTFSLSGNNFALFQKTSNWQSTSRLIASNELSYQGAKLSTPFSDSESSEEDNVLKASKDDPYIGGVTPISDSYFLLVLSAIYGFVLWARKKYMNRNYNYDDQ